MKKRFSEEQIVAILREGQSGEKTVEQLCRAHRIAQRGYIGKSVVRSMFQSGTGLKPRPSAGPSSRG